jgi:hypothetical protein
MVAVSFEDLVHNSQSEVGVWNGRERAEYCPELAIREAGKDRRSPQQHEGVGAIRQEKTPTKNGWGFDIGSGMESRTKRLPTARYIGVLASCEALHSGAIRGD